MSQASLIPSLQSDALVREIERQLKDENAAIEENALREARSVVAQARAAARARVHEAIADLREEGARRLTRARAQLETEARARAQQQAATAVRDAMPMLRDALAARWRARDSRKQWTDAVAALCARRLRPGAWTVAHPKDWGQTEQKQFAAALGKDTAPNFKADGKLAAGLRVSADGAMLDATPQGLLADAAIIAALLLNEIGGGAE